MGYGAGDFPDGVYAKGNYQGSQYAVPWSVTPLGLYINQDAAVKAAIAEVPTDNTSYAKDLAALKATGIQGDWADGYVFTGTFVFESLVWQFGGDLYNKDVTKSTLNSDAGVKALTWMTDMVENGYSPANVAQDGNIEGPLAG